MISSIKKTTKTIYYTSFSFEQILFSFYSEKYLSLYPTIEELNEMGHTFKNGNGEFGKLCLKKFYQAL